MSWDDKKKEHELMEPKIYLSEHILCDENMKGNEFERRLFLWNLMCSAFSGYTLFNDNFHFKF